MKRAMRPVSRKHGNRPLASRILICTEGKSTEGEYLKAYADSHRHPGVRLKPIPVGGDPRAVVERAIGEKRKLERGSSANRDSVWAMFDRDDHPRFHEAKDLARGNGIRLAVSDPCFELWGVLHYQNQDGPIDRSECQRKLEILCDGYSRTGGKLFTDATVITENYLDAVARAKRLLINRDREQRPEGNPSTTVHHLTEHIRCIDDR